MRYIADDMSAPNTLEQMNATIQMLGATSKSNIATL